MVQVSSDRLVIKPQAGPQEDFCRSAADITIFGGARFGGKTYALSMEAMRSVQDKTYSGAIFRRTYPRMVMSGSIWDTANLVGRALGAKPTTSPTLQLTYPSKAKLQFLHCENETDKNNYLGAQFTFLGFDQIEEFSESQFWFLWTCNRSGLGCKIKPTCRGTCNPVPKPHWLRLLLDWWINPETGYPIEERSGVLRWFARDQDKLIWVEEGKLGPNGDKPKSLTFIPATIDSNPIGMKDNPDYKALLEATDKVTRERFRYGNWNIVESSGIFQAEWFPIVPTAPENLIEYRMWDRAATVQSEKNPNPDWTAGGRGGMLSDTLYVRDIQHFRETPAKNKERILNTAHADGRGVTIAIEKEPGSAGVDTIDDYRNLLKDFSMFSEKPVGKKEQRALALSAAAEHGKVILIQGAWNQPFLTEAAQYPNGKKDQIDCITALLSICKRMARVMNGFDLDKHVKRFEIETIDANAVKCILALRITATLEVIALFCIWDAKAGKLWVIDERIMAQADATETLNLAKSVFQGCAYRAYADEEFFSGKRVVKPLAWLFRKAGIKVIQNRSFEERSSIEMLNDLFNIDPTAVTIADHCVTLRRQMLEWLLDKQTSTGVTVDAVRCLLMVVNVLIKQPPPITITRVWRGYSKLAKEWSRAKKEAIANGTIAEFMSSGGIEGTVVTDGFQK